MAKARPISLLNVAVQKVRQLLLFCCKSTGSNRAALLLVVKRPGLDGDLALMPPFDAWTPTEIDYLY